MCYGENTSLFQMCRQHFNHILRLRKMRKSIVHNNAVKFTPRGQIVCSAKMRTADTVEFAVADTGCGMTLEDQAVIFDKFQQAGSTLTEKPSGTGLGLSICRELVTRMGGEITVQSEVNVGSTFYFYLPIPPANGG